MSTSEVVLTMNEENKDFVAHLSEKSGLRASTVKEIIQLQDIILTEVRVTAVVCRPITIVYISIN